MSDERALSYRQLDAARLGQSISALTERIRERFPDASLAQVSTELLTISTEHSAQISRISRARPLLRLFVALLITALAALLVYVIRLIDFSKTSADSVYSVLQGIEATLNIFVLVVGSLIFMVSVEQRLKRNRALRALGELRSIVHVIDMHQLTKDPASLFAGGAPTANSPKRTMTPFQLGRYLDYCSELLALTGKVAVLYAQSLPDPVVVEAVSDLERLTTSLSQKIWQKIAILEASRRSPTGDHRA
jgi:hypothetical protein